MESLFARIFQGVKRAQTSPSAPIGPSEELREAHGRVSWIYDFWKALAPYAYARTEDNVVILPPNLVYKTNATGAQLIDFLGRGGSFLDIPGFCLQRAAEIDAFFKTMKAAYEGKPVSIERVAYDFSFTTLPVLGEIAVTYACNNSCRFCYAGCNADAPPDPSGSRLSECVPPPKDTTDQLDTAGMKRVIDMFRDEAKIPFFSFTGGEPLLRDDLEELAAHATGRGLRINLITNATLATESRARSLYAAGLRTAQVSIESPDAAVHDGLCGVPGCFDATVSGIKALMAAGLSVQTNSTLTRKNRDSLLSLPAFVAALGIKRMSMNLFIPAGSGASADGLFVPYSEAGSFVDEARKAAKEAGVDFFWYSPTPLCIYNPIARGLGNKSCAACDGLLSVSPTGDVLPCSSWPEPVGNLIADGFASVWSGGKALWFKRKEYAPEACRRCDAFAACQAACPLYWRHAGYAELEKHGRSPWKHPATPDCHKARS